MKEEALFGGEEEEAQAPWSPAGAEGPRWFLEGFAHKLCAHMVGAGEIVLLQLSPGQGKLGHLLPGLCDPSVGANRCKQGPSRQGGK